jgi:ribosomal protein S6
VELGDSKGMLFQPSEEEEAVQRWARHDFLGLDRQIAKRWRKMIEQIDLQAMSRTVCSAIGPWRKPVSLHDARAMTDTIIDNLEPEWLLRFGLELLGVSEATEHALNDWRSNRKKPLRTYRPYFIHMLSINIFFGLVLQTQLLSKVKASHQIDLAYLYYLPFCAVFSSRDNFHVQIAPLFMQPAQQFVHGDDLKADLKRLDELYLQLPAETRERALYTFAQFPPDDSSYLITRLWDTYLPDWRKDLKNVVNVPQEVKDALKELVEKYQQATATQGSATVTTDNLAFAQLSRQIKPRKGDYFRIAKDVALRAHEEELKKNVKVHRPALRFRAAGRAYSTKWRSEMYNLEVTFLSNELDEHGEKLLGMESTSLRCVQLLFTSSATRPASA